MCQNELVTDNPVVSNPKDARNESHASVFICLLFSEVIME